MYLPPHSHSQPLQPQSHPIQLGRLATAWLHRLLNQQTASSTAGTSMAEMLGVLAILGILSAIALPSIGYGYDPLGETSNRMAATFKLVRAKAMTHTSAYVIQPISATELEVRRAASCALAELNTSEVDPTFSDEDLTFEDGVQLSAATENGNTVATNAWNLCYTSRGLADKNLNLTFLRGETTTTQQMEVFPGGTIEVRE